MAYGVKKRANRLGDSAKPLPRVLLVDDDPAFGRLIEWILEGIAEVDVRDCVEEVLDRIREGWPDLVVSDLNMPDCNGIELYVKIRDLPGGRDVPFALLTGTLSFEDGAGPLAEATEAGIEQILNKDLGLDGLRKRLVELMTGG